MAFRKKFRNVFDLQPDLLVIQECENEDKLKDFISPTSYNQLLWYGDNQHKGIAIISFNSVQIEINPSHNTEFRYVIPVLMKYGNRHVNLLAIWAMPHPSGQAKSYVGQVWGAIQYYKELLSGESMLIGDFNSNAIWDNQRKSGNHTSVVDYLTEKNIYSIYHQCRIEPHGEEIEPTLFLLKKESKPYHMDYCFASKSLISSTTTITLGRYSDWISLSDHMPVIVTNLLTDM